MKEILEESLKKLTEQDLATCPVCKRHVKLETGESMSNIYIGEIEGKGVFQRYHLNCYYE